MQQDDAETIAIKALTFLATRPEDMSRFLALTGSNTEELKSLAQTPEGLGGILDYILSDEALLLAFVERSKLNPEDPAKARRALPGFIPLD